MDGAKAENINLKNVNKDLKLPKSSQNSSIFILFFRGVKLGLINFWRNKVLSLATILVIAVILFIFNIILAVQSISKQALQSLNEHIDIVIDIKDDITFYDAQNLVNKLQKAPGIRSVQYRSKEEALEIVAKTHPETVEIYKKFNLPNPLPPSIIITLQNPDDYQKIQKLLKQNEYQNFLQTNSYENSQSAILSSVANNLSNINNFVRQMIFWVIFAFIIGGTLVIVNAIQLTIYTRRQEIYIMRLVGATPAFIRLPFLVEGGLYALFALLISFFFLLILGKTIQIETTNLWTYYNNFQIDKILIAELLMTMILSFISSFLAVQQYLKGKLMGI